jgi:VanZ family protein
LKLTRFLPGIAWFCTSFYLFTLPGNRLPKFTWFDKIYGDKIVHVGIFALLIALFLMPFLHHPPKKIKRIALLLALCGIIYGTAIEFIQGNFIPNRSFDVWDIVADTAGSFIPFLLLPFFKETRIS